MSAASGVVEEDRTDWSENGGDLDRQDLVQRLLSARRSVHSQVERVGGAGDTGHQQGVEERFKHVVGETAVCSDHPETLLEYWCEDDSHMVCRECLIFGEHKGHTAIMKKQKRFDHIVEERLERHVPSLQAELDNVEEAKRQIAVYGLDGMNEVKTNIIRCLDDMFMQERDKVTFQLSEHLARLEQAISSIQSHHNMPNLDIKRLIQSPARVTIVPSTVVRQGTKLVVDQPRILLTGGDGASSDSGRDTSSTVTKSPPASSSVQIGTSRSISSSSAGLEESLRYRVTPVIKQLDPAKLDGIIVHVLKNGSPALFFCRAVVSSQEELVNRLLDMPFQSRIFPPSPGEGVLARWDGQWCRASVVESVMTGWRCQLVDLGQVVTVATLEIADMPECLVDIPAMAVSCSLVGAVGRQWSEEATQDWEKLVSGKQFVMQVEDKAMHTVNLIQEDVDIFNKLQFLGHLPAVFDTARPGQHFSQPVELSAAASLCADYQQISPDSILLYFDNHRLGDQLDILEQLNHLHLVGPPGHVQPCHAVLAPWKGTLYRATVQAVTGTTLTLLYVDFGNIDIVSWWDCYIVPMDLLFPPLATMVRLAGARAEEVGSWTRECCDRLRQILSGSKEKLEVKIVKMAGNLREAVEVDLIVWDGNKEQSVMQFLADEGYACGEVEITKIQERISLGRDEISHEVKDQDTLYQPDEKKSGLADENQTVQLVGKKDYTESKDVDNRVYLTGTFPLNGLTEMDLCTWAEELWGEVDMVMIGHNQVVIDFCSSEVADFCYWQKRAVFGKIVMEIFPSKLRLLNGVRVTGLSLLSRRTDVLNIFNMFGNIAFVEGPFAQTIPVCSKKATVVFKDPKVVESVLRSDAIKQKGRRLCVHKFIGSKHFRSDSPEPTKLATSALLCSNIEPPANPFNKDMELEVVNVYSLTPLANEDVVVEEVNVESPTPLANEDVDVEVVNVESPDQVWVRLVADKDKWTQLHQVMQELGNALVEERKVVEVKNGQKVICRVEGVWYRGRVMEEDGIKTWKVKLVDLGLIVNVENENVSELDHSYLLKEKVFARSVRLGRLEPAGSGGWSGSSVDFLKRWTKNRKVFLVKDGQFEDLMVEEVSADNPTDVETVSRVSLADMLLQRGLALKLNTRRKCASSWTGHVVGYVTPVIGEVEYTEVMEMMKDDKKATTGLFAHGEPQVPAEQVFPARLVHIDCSAVVWVIPEDDLAVLEDIERELVSSTDTVEAVTAGMMVVGSIRGKRVRGKVLEEGESVILVDVDSGEVFLSNHQDLHELCHTLLHRPPLAIPVKLYGARKTTSALCKTGRALVMDGMKEMSPSMRCLVSVVEIDTKSFPLPVNVRYSVVEEYDGNLAMDMMKVGLCEVITSSAQWEKELSDHGLEWLLDPMSELPQLSLLPHPLPLATGQWLNISVEGLEDDNVLGVHFRLLDTEAVFDKHQMEISSSLRSSNTQVERLVTSFNEDRLSLAMLASTAEVVDSPIVEQDVLVYYALEEGGEWCRSIVKESEGKDTVSVYFTDYGHSGQVEVKHLRSMSYLTRMKPMQLRKVMFNTSDSDQEGKLEIIRDVLCREYINPTEERLMMRVDNITHSKEVEEVFVSVWRATVADDNHNSFNMIKIV